TEADLQDIAVQVLKILVYLHSLSPPLIHRDIKPPNIIRQPDGTLFLVDFGTVQAIYRETFLGSNTFVGTAGYMPPEQFRGQAIAASDLYSLGATLIFLATQRTPDQLPQNRMKVNVADCTTFSPKFTTWLAKLLEPIPEDRFQTAAEALDSLMPATNNGSESHRSIDDESIFNASMVSDRDGSMVTMPQPTGARSTVERSTDSLRITIPLRTNSASLFQSMGQKLTGVRDLLAGGQWSRTHITRSGQRIGGLTNLIALGFIGLLLLPLIVTLASIGLALFFMLLSFWPMWFIGLIIFLVNHRRCDTMVLEVTEQEFCLRHIRQGRDQKVYRGNSQILYASLGPEQSQSKHPRMACVLTEHTRRRYTMHYIGQHLTPSEQEWLVDEISLFLKSIKFRDT
ncbi:MAG: protein kinase, partial [Merismopedia sp. SIO2A8]|nr:protein kinase [Merismopedia sp. SIO2A8]